MKLLNWLRNVLDGQAGTTKSSARTSDKQKSEEAGILSTDAYRKLMDEQEAEIMEIRDKIQELEKREEKLERRYRTYAHMYTYHMTKEKK